MESLKINIGDSVKVRSSSFHNFKEDQIVKIKWSDLNVYDIVEDLLKNELEKLQRLDNISNEILLEMFLCSFADQIKKQF